MFGSRLDHPMTDLAEKASLLENPTRRVTTGWDAHLFCTCFVKIYFG
jgi:hypothetical protein